MADYGIPNRFKANMDATVSSFSSQVQSKAGNISTKITSYNVQSLIGSYNQKMPLRSTIIGDKKTLESKLSKSTIYRDIKIDKRKIGFKAYAYENVSPMLQEVKVWLGSVVGKQMAKAIKDGIIKGVKRKYKNRNEHTWAENTPAWKEYKERRGYDTRPMHMRDKNPLPGLGTVPGSVPLATTVSSFGDKIGVMQVAPDTYEVYGLDEEFMESPYVWFHEVGYTTRGMFPGRVVPARPFIAPGVNEAMAYATGTVMNRNPATSPRKRKKIFYELKPGVSSEMEMKSRTNLSDMMSFLWWFMPQVSEWRYFGYVHDAQGYMSGHFISFDTMKHFISALVYGKLGVETGLPVTRKLARRTSRKALWGSNESVSIFGGL